MDKSSRGGWARKWVQGQAGTASCPTTSKSGNITSRILRALLPRGRTCSSSRGGRWVVARTAALRYAGWSVTYAAAVSYSAECLSTYEGLDEVDESIC